MSAPPLRLLLVRHGEVLSNRELRHWIDRGIRKRCCIECLIPRVLRPEQVNCLGGDKIRSNIGVEAVG